MKLPEWLRAFLSGAGTVLDISPTIPSYEEQFGTDEELLEHDRQMINQDFQKALDKILEEEDKS